MTFDPRKTDALAKQGQLADVAIDVCVALAAIGAALNKISKHSAIDIKDELEDIRLMTDSLEKRFDKWTGFSSND